MKKILALISIWVSAAMGITNVTLPYTIDTASIPKVRYIDKNDSALKWGVNNLGDTLNAATGTGNLVRKTGGAGVSLASPTTTGTLAAANGTFSGTLGVTGLATASGGIASTGSVDVTTGDVTVTDVIAGVPYLKATTSDAPTAINQTGGELRLGLQSRLATIKSLVLTNIGSETWAANPRTGLAFYTTQPAATPEVMRITDQGRLLLGTTTDNGQLLQINGSALISGGVTMSSTLSVTGQTNVTGSVGVGAGAGTPADKLTVQDGVTGDLAIRVRNTNSGATDRAGINLITPAGGGDPFLSYVISGTQTWTEGIDNSASDAWTISEGSALGTNNRLQISVGGAVSIPGVTTFTAAPVFSSVSASQILSVDGSKNLTSTATTGSGSVMLAASPTTTGTLTLDTLVSSKFYEEGSFTGTLTGCTTSPTGTVVYTRVGKIVTMKIPQIEATSNATTMTVTGIPSAIRPSVSWFFACSYLKDAGSFTTTQTTQLSVQATGTVNFTLNGSSTGFTNSGTKGTGSGVSFTYTLQ